ncbi:MAG: hypothetical protein AAFX40_05070 [Cyanobacteria bacterium J06639_1]
MLNITRRIGLGVLSAALIAGVAAPIASAMEPSSLRDLISISRERNGSARFTDIALLDQIIEKTMETSNLALVMMESDDPEVKKMAEALHAKAEADLTALQAERKTFAERLRQFRNN